jgi:hypothetical protein
MYSVKRDPFETKNARLGGGSILIALIARSLVADKIISNAPQVVIGVITRGTLVSY